MNSEIKKAIENRILVLDGAMGTAIQQKKLTAADFGGEDFEGCNEYLVITRPDVIASIHDSYLEAGADIIETNTFGGTALVLAEYELQSRTYEINFAAAQIARKCADRFSTKEQPRFVAGSIGPTTKAISVTGGVTFERLIDEFEKQAEALAEGGIDYYLIETCQDTRNIKATLIGLDRLFARKPHLELPIAISGTIERMGTMLAGQSIEALYASVAHRDLLYIGLNCATGPEFMTDHVRSLAQISRFAVACVPNAGLPDEHGCYLDGPDKVSEIVSRFIQNGWINVIGGCCGTHSGHIQALSQLAKGKKPRTSIPMTKSILSGIDYLEINDEMRPIIVGERTNSIGSRKFKRLIAESKFEEAAEIARAQVKNGAQIIDVCLANPDRDELEDSRHFLEAAIKLVRAPLMIDSTDAEVMAQALTYCQGKAILNSINLEDGEERFEKVLPLARAFGAGVVVGTIDEDKEQGMGITRARKLEIARRSYQLLTEKYKIIPEDIYWDPLVFPCATGDAQYTGSALETIEGIRLLKQEFPRTKTVLGISNVSFGLPEHGREVLNSVFLYHCVQAGLDLAIVNSEKLVRFAQISTEEKLLSENLLFNRGADPIADFTAHFRTKAPTASISQTQSLPLKERLSRYIVEGTKVGLVKDLDEALKSTKPLEIINGPLMTGMDEVGRLFNTNQLIVAEVLQSAEVMKAAVTHLEPFMEKADMASRGKILLATVKGDVHDIGKNLVEIILSNNGFQVVNLGIKVNPEVIIQAAREQKPDLIGLSGLLVKSAHQMVTTAEDLNKSNIAIPILVGGAALSQNFVDRQISKAYGDGVVTYARDAMEGLDIAKNLMDPDKKILFLQNENTRRLALAAPEDYSAFKSNAPIKSERSKEIERLVELPKAPDFERHIETNAPIKTLWDHINPLMLYTRHIGIKGGIAKKLDLLNRLQGADRQKVRNELEIESKKSLEIFDAIEAVKAEFIKTPLFHPKAVYQFYRCKSEGDLIRLFDKDSKQIGSFTFLRQKKENGLCLSDYIDPIQLDSLSLFVTTAGDGVRERAQKLKENGEYLKSHILSALAIETAEGYAEFLHAELRKSWGYPDAPGTSMLELFQAKYHGKRYSFGYPACPHLEDQTELFRLLKPEDIGVQLTEGFMMDPEASVSAIVFHHPQSNYFSVGNITEDQRQS